MKWVTWQNVGVDRIGCAWLIRTRIDPRAEFLFIPFGSKAIPKGAEPFDMPGVRLSHHGGHCSFHTIVKEYKLKDPILDRIARIVDEADTIQEVLVEPVAPGLDLLCRGVRRASTGDQMAIEHGRILYDALYAELQSEMTAGDPTCNSEVE